MHAVLAGRGRRPVHRSGGNRFIYTGSLAHNFSDCYRCTSMTCFVCSGLSAACGIMLVTFGSTNFFQTKSANHTCVIVGIAMLASTLLLIILGFSMARKGPPRSLHLAPGAASCTEEHQLED